MMSREELKKCRSELLDQVSTLRKENADLLIRAQNLTAENGQERMKSARLEFERDMLFKALDMAAR